MRGKLSDKFKLLDQYIHELVKHFYLKTAMDGPSVELSTSEVFACSVLGRQSRCTMSELAKECGLALSSMTGVIDRLVSKEYVRRTRDDGEDRRKVFVKLDRKGEKIYQELLESEMEMIIAMMESLKPQEQDALIGTLGKAVESLKK